jgi:putative heme-binding domain-containing protein
MSLQVEHRGKYRPCAATNFIMLLAVTFLPLLAPAPHVNATQENHAAGVSVTLESHLLSEKPADLARDARRNGNPARGAILFYQPTLTCTQCHVGSAEQPTLGPDLAQASDNVSDAYLVESILQPSKVIKKGYETLTVVTTKGRSLTGLLVREDGTTLVLRDAAQGFTPVTLRKSDIEEREVSPVSMMPAGLINQLGTRQEFLDLVRYVLEVHDKGPSRARELRPDPSVLTKVENSLVNSPRETVAGIHTGANIFRQYCFVCHGADGKGTSMRLILPPIPDFTSPIFHKEHSDAQLLISILDGKGTFMPANRGRVTEEQAGGLVAFVRAFGPQASATQSVAADSDFEKAYRQLEDHWNELEKELQKTKGRQ